MSAATTDRRPTVRARRREVPNLYTTFAPTDDETYLIVSGQHASYSLRILFGRKRVAGTIGNPGPRDVDVWTVDTWMDGWTSVLVNVPDEALPDPQGIEGAALAAWEVLP